MLIFEKINKINKTLVILTKKKKRVRFQINKIRNKKGDLTIVLTEIKRIINDYSEQLHTNKLDNLEEMDKFLETYNLPRLNHDEIENINRMITSNEIESVVKKFQQIKGQDQTDSLINSTKHSRKN